MPAEEPEPLGAPLLITVVSSLPPRIGTFWGPEPRSCARQPLTVAPLPAPDPSRVLISWFQVQSNKALCLRVAGRGPVGWGIHPPPGKTGSVAIHPEHASGEMLVTFILKAMALGL